MDLKGTRTEANLRSAFAGETQARSKYDYFAKAAEKEGFQQIAAIFRETADNEEAHAFLWFSQLGALSNTAQNLVNAQSGEHFEWAEMYEDFARVAEEEGFTDIANKFRQVGAVEKAHEERFLRLLHTVEMQKLRSRRVRKENTGTLPRLRLSEIILPAEARELLTEKLRYETHRS